MELIPAIDLKDGKCVRLRQGRMEDETIFSENPLEMAERWVKEGATRLHLIDLDGAFAGSPKNHKIIREICKAYPDLPVEVGGGIRDEGTVESYLEDGVRYTIIGTKAVSEPHFVNDLCFEFPGHIIIGLDAKDGKVAIDGWSKLSHHDIIDMAQHFEHDGVAAIIYTDISKDGMMQGVNVEATVKLAQAVRVPVIASGGVTNLDDIRRLCEVEEEGISGVIIGRALYEGTIDLAEAEKFVADFSA
ncbi:MAG: 1-(5-phosphoribosyl)-5-((5-phosphoribosylamino)methylideneamino)imidazole-4-carboxamide isomerase [Thiothrix sp.]|nr:MAG: 1-(5-phosphoribosyl)-5-((5-phosphoribosylamino)methylideneamino)imidazole-4-carboxamide isomerase [Thiothrix sp.]